MATQVTGLCAVIHTYCTRPYKRRSERVVGGAIHKKRYKTSWQRTCTSISRHAHLAFDQKSIPRRAYRRRWFVRRSCATGC